MIDFNFLTDFSFDNEDHYSTWLSSIVSSEGKDLGELTYVFCDDEYLHKINVDYLIKELKNITIKKLQNPNLHSNAVSNKVSDIAKIPKIREALLPVQRDLIFNSNEKIMLVGGRDICSKILPRAFSDLKLFIDADVKLRAKRRYLELLSNKKEQKIEYKEILNALKARDSADKNRKVSPLKKTRDSVLINNNSNDISRPVKRIIDLLEKEIKKH